MITAHDRTKLVMHYSPGILTMLRREPCPGHDMPFGGISHQMCPCWDDHHIHKFVSATEVHGDETAWCLEQCWTDREKVNTE